MFELIQKDRYQILGPVHAEYTEHEGCILTLPQTGVDWACKWLPGPVAPSAQPVEKEAALESIAHPVLASVAVSGLPQSWLGSASDALYPLSAVGPHLNWTAIITAHANGSGVPVLAEMKY